MKIAKNVMASGLVLAALLAVGTVGFISAAEQPTLKTDLQQYQGPWVTTNRKLNGTLNCLVQKIDSDKWRGRFWGVWEHVPMDYTVEFGRQDQTAKDGGRLVSIGEKAIADGIPITGKATIDGANYEWIGVMSPEEFDIQFTGSRYEGHLELKRVPVGQVATPAVQQ
jgi:hypothetical protein